MSLAGCGISMPPSWLSHEWKPSQVTMIIGPRGIPVSTRIWALAAVLVLIGCGVQEVPVEVTRIVESTREIEVTRIVEITPLATPRPVPPVMPDNVEQFVYRWYGTMSSNALSRLSCTYLQNAMVFSEAASWNTGNPKDFKNTSLIAGDVGEYSGDETLSDLWTDVSAGRKDAIEEIYAYCADKHGLSVYIEDTSGERYQMGKGYVTEKTPPTPVRSQPKPTPLRSSPKPKSLQIRGFSFLCFDIVSSYNVMKIAGHDTALAHVQNVMNTETGGSPYIRPSDAKQAWDRCR